LSASSKAPDTDLLHRETLQGYRLVGRHFRNPQWGLHVRTSRNHQPRAERRSGLIDETYYRLCITGRGSSDSAHHVGNTVGPSWSECFAESADGNEPVDPQSTSSSYGRVGLTPHPGSPARGSSEPHRPFVRVPAALYKFRRGPRLPGLYELVVAEAFHHHVSVHAGRNHDLSAAVKNGDRKIQSGAGRIRQSSKTI